MTDPAARELVERRSDEAFARSEWQDPRADYRALLRRLKEQDSAAFESAVREYDERVAARLRDERADPVRAWLDYGLRLAQLAGGGRTVSIDADGRSTELPEAGPTAPALLLHLPADEAAAAIVVGAPREPSGAQRAAVMLLAERRTALTG